MPAPRGPRDPAQTLRPPCNVLRVYFTMANDARLSRFMRTHTSADVLNQLPTLIRHAQECFGSAVVSATLASVPSHKHEHSVRSHGFRFTNICGKIHHLYSSQFFAPGVLPLVVKVVNGFGHFECLYSIHTNLLTAQNRHNTLFRGGRCCTEISKVIQHAFCTDAIDEIHVHMMVANIRMPHPICIACLAVDRALAAHPDLTCVSMCMTEDQSYMKSIKISRVSTTFQQAHLPHTLVDENMSMLVNLSRSGSVNVFLTIAKQVPLREGLEQDYTPLLAAILRVVDRFT